MIVWKIKLSIFFFKWINLWYNIFFSPLFKFLGTRKQFLLINAKEMINNDKRY